MYRRGRLWYFWKHPVNTLNFISKEPSLFHSLLTMALDEPEVMITTINAPGASSQCPHFWNQLANDPPPHNHPWLVLGNLNTATTTVEKKGGRELRISNCRACLNFLNTCSLIDLGFSGPPFNWDNGRLGTKCIQERLYRALSNPSWLQVYPYTQVTHLP